MLRTGGLGLPFAKHMIESFNSYNDKDKLKNIENYIVQLEVEHIVIIHDPQKYGTFPASLIFTRICKQLSIYCTVIAARPFIWEGNARMRRFNECLGLFDTDELHVIDADSVDELKKVKTATDMRKMYNEFIYELALERLT